MASQRYLFGGDEPWNSLDWTSSNDRVRGGASLSHLDCNPLNPIALFSDALDIKTLGGAGFASQRTTDGKRYTLTVKDKLLPKRWDGRDQSTVSWKFDFEGKEGKVLVPWEELKATYRGREKKDAEPLDLKGVMRISLMMRSLKIPIPKVHGTGTTSSDHVFSRICAASRNFKLDIREFGRQAWIVNMAFIRTPNYLTLASMPFAFTNIKPLISLRDVHV
ncbi:hypothetical protein G7Y89_g11099 [Cudoniella acicularis]|uniref:NADH:ubiquinone oxidoreductase intermediate-associated protein 30 domain-containing protein n=1 Tax=Cudoniella acicularis TaxID=354080 RepID=A0A8H4RBI3_9HELO|nr:hypothetical protein G7Y89_g11099 [Cudoniella acicularis]